MLTAVMEKSRKHFCKHNRGISGERCKLSERNKKKAKPR
jgi:hypothetical protein